MQLLKILGGKKLEERVNFEYALETLENIINRLEQGNETLDGTVKLYNEGAKLISICQKNLSLAQNEIEEINSNMQSCFEDDK